MKKLNKAILVATAVPVAVFQAVMGWPLAVAFFLFAASAGAQEAELDAGSTPPVEYPAQVEPRRGQDEGLVKITLSIPENPGDGDLTSARVFSEPLIPVGEAVVEGENVALGNALRGYVAQTDREDVHLLDDFMVAYPGSRWKAALQTNLGVLRRKAGYFTEALGRLEEAWALGKGDSTHEGAMQANYAVGQLVDLNARFGRFDRMKELLDETAARDISGSAQTLLWGARQGYWMMTEKPGEGFRCGPYAVNAVLCAGKEYVPDPQIAQLLSTQQGTSLAQNADLAKKVGLNLVAAKRSSGGAWPLPMVVHWKVGHFAAILRREKNRFLIADPTFGGEIWVTEGALNAESSGYGLVPLSGGKLPSGWVEVPDEEAAQVWGRGGSATSDINATCDSNTTVPPCPPKPPMAVYSIFKMLATLQIWDSPVGYAPPVGSPVRFTVSYKHLEAGQPTNFTYANFGPFWECNWVSFAQVDSGGTVTVNLRGGGAEVYNYSTYDPATGNFPRSLYSGAHLIRKSASRYERETVDGSREVYSQPDSTGRLFLKEVVDRNGNKTILNYDAKLRVTSIVDAIGQATAITYLSNSASNAGYYKVARVTDPFGRSAEFTYDSAKTRLIKIRDVIGIESSFTYGNNGFISRMTTPYGNTDFYQYEPVPVGDGLGRGLLVVLPDGSKEVMESYRGHVLMSYYWDRKAMAMAPGDRDMAEQTHWLLSKPDRQMMDVPDWIKKPFEGRVQYGYPDESSDGSHSYVGSLRFPSSITRTLDDNTQQVYQYEYNAFGQVVKSVDPLGRTFKLIYGTNGIDLMEMRQTRAGNNDLLGKWTYDDRRNPVTSTDASGRKTTFFYNSRGQVETATNAKNETTTYAYDANGYLTKVDGPLAGDSDRTDFTYDNYGRVRTATSVEGPASSDQWTRTFDYDALDRVTRITYPDSTTEEAVYSRLDLRRSKDRLGRWTQFLHNALRQVVEMRDPAGRITKYEWCRCGALQKLTDPLGRETHWTYDVQGRLTKKTYADASEQTYEYETAISRLKKMTDPAGNVANYKYYIDNTPYKVEYDPASGFADVPDVTFTWDPNYRRPATVGDSLGVYTYTYGPFVSNFYGSAGKGRGMLSGVLNGVLANADISYEYDELGRPAKRQVNGTANESQWHYDTAGRLSDWSNPLGTFTPTYVNDAYGVGRMDNLSYPNGQEVHFDWEENTGDFRLKEIRNLGAGSAELSRFNYVTDAGSRILEWKQQKGSAGAERFDLGYNAVDELTGAVLKTDASNAIVRQFYYGYDAAGNRTSRQEDASVKSSTYNNLNQITGTGAGGATRFRGSLNKPGNVSVNGEAAWMQGGTNFVADVPLSAGTNTVSIVATDGNANTQTNSYQVVVPVGGNSSYSYDGNGNMTGDGSKSYGWDAAGRLVKVTQAGGGWTEYSYDALGRRVKIEEKDSGGTPTSTKQFVFDGMEEVEQRDGNNNVTKRYFPEGFQIITNSPFQIANYSYTRDHLGSIREIVDGSGALVSRYDYDPYGKVEKESGTVESDMLYTGHYYDATSALCLTMFRAYDPELGRWPSRDPIGEQGGINLYGYVSNNPINLWDPLGLVDQDVFNPNDPTRSHQSKINTPHYDFGGHGYPKGIADQRNTANYGPKVNDPMLSASGIADLIKNDKGNFHGQPVQMFSCSTGAGGHPIAQDVANKLKVPVLAPTDILWVDNHGNWRVEGFTGLNQTNEGEGWKWFYPK